MNYINTIIKEAADHQESNRESAIDRAINGIVGQACDRMDLQMWSQVHLRLRSRVNRLVLVTKAGI